MTGPRDTGAAPRASMNRIKTGVFSAIRNMRHELRTSLNQIIGYSELLEEELEDKEERELIGDVNKIQTAARNMLDSINTIFDADGAVETRAPVEPNPDAPAEEAPTVRADSEEAAPAPAGEVRGSLLVVDDSEANRELLARRLIKQGYDVAMASGGAEALRLVQDEGSAATAAGAPYDLSLASRTEELRPLAAEAPFHYQVEQAKRFGGDPFLGHLLELGQNSAQARLQGPLAERTNLKLTLLDQAGAPTPGALHAKVLAADGDVCTLGFTFKDPEVAARLEELS